MKINECKIGGLRGVKQELQLDLKGNSALIFGENGVGKSTISDVIEWFYYNRIEHLSNEEIDRNGLSAMRNVGLGSGEKCFVDLKLSNDSCSSGKFLEEKKKSILSTFSNDAEGFKDYIDASKRENIVLRYASLVDFILSTKTEKLNSLFEIIGFGELIKTKSVLKKILNELKKVFRNKSFREQRGLKQKVLIDHLKQNVESDEQFLKCINDLASKLKIKEKITDIGKVEEILKNHEAPDQSSIITKEVFLNDLNAYIGLLQQTTIQINSDYASYEKHYSAIKDDLEKLKKIRLESLLSEGAKLIRDNVVTEDKCPLCLQEKNKGKLLEELTARLEEFKKHKDEKGKLEDERVVLRECLKSVLQRINDKLTNKYFEKDFDIELTCFLTTLKEKVDQYLVELDVDVLSGKDIKKKSEVEIKPCMLSDIKSGCDDRIKSCKKNQKNDVVEINVSIRTSTIAYRDIKFIDKERDILERQIKSIEVVNSEYLKKQKDSIESFISGISSGFSDLYQYMNPNENVKDLKLKLMENIDGELEGVTFEYGFFDSVVTPAQKYLSESHLNCLGIAIFLVSVKVFNKINKFIVLDDVISSFDTGHRKRFADMLIEKFSDYQIIILTHESTWFEYVKNKIKGKRWIIKEVKWMEGTGTYLDETTKSLKERIEQKIKCKEKVNLGSDSRKYLEGLLKTAALNLEVKVLFQFNDKNENRMSGELLSCLKAEINKKSSLKLKSSPVIERLNDSLFLGNKDSHDSDIKLSFDDQKGFWEDVQEFESLLTCDECGRMIAMRYYDAVNKEVRCGCSEGLKYGWQK